MLHALFGNHGFITSDHLDKCVAFVNIYDAGLYSAECQEYGTQIILRRTTPRQNRYIVNELGGLRYATHKESSTED